MAPFPHKFEPVQGWPDWEMAKPWQYGPNTNGGMAWNTELRRVGGILVIPFVASGPGVLVANVIEFLQEKAERKKALENSQ